MRFQVLGTFRVTDGSESLALGPPQQQKLLALLCAAANRNVSSDRLIDDIWGDSPPPSAAHLIQVYVSKLRKLLGDPSVIATDRGAYSLQVSPDALDSLQFERCIEQARRSKHPDAAERRSLLNEAISLWRGPPFGELAEESDTLRQVSTRLTELLLGALEERIEIDLEDGRHEEVVAEVDRLRQEHEYRERFWEQWMLALYRCGRQVDALRAFQSLRTLLAEELGIEPGSRATELENSILLQDPALQWEPQPPPSNLPIAVTSFVGRDLEIAEVAKLLDTGRVVTLTGPGGIGKTRLATEAAKRVQSRFSDGIWWIDLSAVSDPELVPAEFARSLGVSAPAGRTLSESVAQSLVGRRALLVVDNCEHLARSVADVSELVITSSEEVQILATSRTPLGLAGEALWEVPTLALPLTAGPASTALPHSDAVGLFVERAAAVDPGFDLDATNAPEITSICQRLDGMPLAIEMAAARVRVLSPADILTSLTDRFSILRQPGHSQTSRHETLQTAIDWSYQLLKPELGDAFCNVAVFAGSFDLDAADRIAFGEVGSPGNIETITALVDSSLVKVDSDGRGGKHFRLLETLREYGKARLEVSGDLDRQHQRHAEYFIEMVVAATAAIGEPSFADLMSKLDASYDDLQQALEWSLNNHPREVTLQTAPALQHYWLRKGDAREARRWGLRMLAGADSAPAALRSSAHSAVNFGTILLAKHPQEAINHADRALELARSGDSPRVLTNALHGRSNAALMVGDFDTVVSTSNEMLSISEELDFRWERAGALCMQSFARFFGGGSLAEAREFGEAALTIFQSVGDIGSQVVMNPLSAIAVQQGDLEAAERYALDAATVAVGSGWEATALVNLGGVYLANGDVEKAQATLRTATRRALDSGLENWFRMSLRELAQVAAGQGDPGRAARLIGASRRNMPMWGLTPEIYEHVEEMCLETMEPDAFEAAAAEGFAMTIAELLEVAMGPDLEVPPGMGS